MSKSCDGLRALADVIEEYDIVFSYTIDDDGVHISIAGDEVYVGFLEDLDPASDLRAEADFRCGKT